MVVQLFRRHCWFVLCVLSLSFALGMMYWYIQFGYSTFQADEPFAAIMAQRILDGARYTYFIGQGHFAPIDSYIGSVTLSLFGERSLFAFRSSWLLMVLLHGLLILSIVKRYWGQVPAFMALILISLPGAVTIWFWTGVFHRTALQLGFVLLALSPIPTSRLNFSLYMLAVGFMAGALFWVTPMFILYFLLVVAVRFSESNLWAKIFDRFRSVIPRFVSIRALVLGVFFAVVFYTYFKGEGMLFVQQRFALIGASMLILLSPYLLSKKYRLLTTIAVLLFVLGFTLGNYPELQRVYVQNKVTANRLFFNTLYFDHIVFILREVLPTLFGTSPLPSSTPILRIASYIPLFVIGLYVYQSRSAILNFFTSRKMDRSETMKLFVLGLFLLPVCALFFHGAEKVRELRLIYDAKVAFSILMAITVCTLYKRSKVLSIVITSFFCVSVFVGTVTLAATDFRSDNTMITEVHISELRSVLSEYQVRGGYAHSTIMHQLNFLYHDQIVWGALPNKVKYRDFKFEERVADFDRYAILLHAKEDLAQTSIDTLKGGLLQLGPKYKKGYFGFVIERVDSSEIIHRQKIGPHWDLWILNQES